MPNLLIRNVPAETHARLVSRAETAGLSLQQYVLDLLMAATARMTTKEAVARMRAQAEERAARGETSPTGEDFLRARDEAREERANHLLEVIDEARARRGRLGDQ